MTDRTLFTACLGTETNSFSPIPTGMGLFAATLLARGGSHSGADGQGATLFSLPLVRWRDRARARGWEVVEGLAAFALPAGTTTRATFGALRDEILADLDRAGPVDAVLLNLHGAMIADGHLDAEGELLAAIRHRVGRDVPLLAELDLHAHLTALKVDSADVLVSYKEYPHIDAVARADELFDLCVRMVEDGLRPTMAFHDCRMLGIYPTTREPMQSLVATMKEFEQRAGVLSVSLVHGFPWGDTPEVGTRVLVVTDSEPALAESLAHELGESIWRQRDALLAPFVALDAAIDVVVAAARDDAADKVGRHRPFVLADTADNTGIGAPGDSTFVLARLLERGVGGFAIAPLWDPVAAQLAHDAGIGARLALRLGGKCGPSSGMPVDAEVTVMGLADEIRQPFGGSMAPLGRCAWVRIENGESRDHGGGEGAIDVILASNRVQAFDPICFGAVGLDPTAAGGPRALVVKSTQHFHAGFAPIAREILYLATPGAGSMDFAALAHVRVHAPLWPRVVDPHAIEPIEAVVFDLGRVLVAIEFERTLARWARDAGADSTPLLGRWRQGIDYERHERGEIDDPTFFATVARDLALELSAQQWHDGWLELLREPVTGIEELIDRLDPRLKKAVFSNTNAAHETVLQARYGPLLARFDRVFLSHRLAQRKPEIAAFRMVADELGVAPGRILFFDDLLLNVAGARAAGLQAVMVRSIDDVSGALEAAGVLRPMDATKDSY
ncbi:MAG: HAD-IA family hydrolase [Burkholderiaceae bacterium]